MSLIIEIPKQSRFIQTVNTFTAIFNSPLAGGYDFGNVALNQNQPVINLNQNSIYLIERINVGADIAELDYQTNIGLLPKTVLSYKIEGGRVYQLPIPLVNYVNNQEAVAWAWSDKYTDALLLSMPIGTLNQNAALVGRSEIRIFVALNIYEITDNNFVQQFKSSSTSSAVGFRSPMESTRPIITGSNPGRL